MKKSKLGLLVILVLIVSVAIAIAVRSFIRYRNFDKVSPRQGEIVEAVYGLGKVKTNHRFEVKLGVISTVRNLYVQEGDSVRKGDKLIDFDTNAVFRAPFDGTVTLVSLYEGETALAQNVVLRVEDLKDRFIELSLEQEGALRIKKGQTARVSFETLRGQVLIGKVRTLFPRADEFLAEIEVENLDDSILPGMTADVSVEIGKVSGTLIPLKGVRNGVILVERNGRTQKIKVDVGLIDGLSAEIKGDSLKASDQVLVPKE